MSSPDDLLAKARAETRAEIERALIEGPRPVRYGGYVVHALGQTIWLTPAHNSEDTPTTKQ